MFENKSFIFSSQFYILSHAFTYLVTPWKWFILFTLCGFLIVWLVVYIEGRWLNCDGEYRNDVDCCSSSRYIELSSRWILLSILWEFNSWNPPLSLINFWFNSHRILFNLHGDKLYQYEASALQSTNNPGQENNNFFDFRMLESGRKFSVLLIFSLGSAEHLQWSISQPLVAGRCMYAAEWLPSTV